MWNTKHKIYTCASCGLTYGQEDLLKFYSNDYVDMLFKLVKQFESLNLNTEERALLQGIGLLFTGTTLQYLHSHSLILSFQIIFSSVLFNNMFVSIQIQY